VRDYGVELLDPIWVRSRSPAARAWFSIGEHPCDPAALERSARRADWILQGNAVLVGLPELMSATGRRPVVSWDGDAASRWHATYAQWLLRRDPLRAARRSLMVASARRSERQLLRSCDFVTVPGPADLAALSRSGRHGASMHIVPNVVRFGPDPDPPEVARTIRDVLFVGSAYGPTVDGLRWFLERVWPIVLRHRPHTGLTVAGHNLAKADIYPTAAAPRNVEFVGKVADLELLYRSAKVSIIPVFYGSGVPNKFLEALAANTGIVFTEYVANAVGFPGGLRHTNGVEAWGEALLEALEDPNAARVDPRVRAELLALHGPRGFDLAMRAVLASALRARGR